MYLPTEIYTREGWAGRATAEELESADPSPEEAARKLASNSKAVKVRDSEPVPERSEGTT